jgi:hypothetical protein
MNAFALAALHPACHIGSAVSVGIWIGESPSKREHSFLTISNMRVSSGYSGEVRLACNSSENLSREAQSAAV